MNEIERLKAELEKANLVIKQLKELVVYLELKRMEDRNGTKKNRT